MRARYVEVFDRAARSGEIGPNVDGALVLDTLRGALTTLTSGRPDWEADDFVDYLVRLVLDGIRTG